MNREISNFCESRNYLPRNKLYTKARRVGNDSIVIRIIKNKYFSNLVTVGHIPRPREILWHVHFFIKTEGRKVNGHC